MKDNTSTSFHKINYDKPLSNLKKIIWFIFNYINNSFKNYKLDKKIKQINFRPTKSSFDKLSFELSPLRYLTDLFIMEMPWHHFADSLGKIRLLEVGSGTGIYGEFINSILDDKLEIYTGVDPKSHNLDKINDKFNFHLDISDNIEKYIENHNVILTITALEHFENDLLFFKKIQSHIKKTKKKILQIHIVPSYACLKTYLGHGLRQYTPRTISKITNLFEEDKKYLFSLGNDEFNKLTFEYITIPRIFKKTDKRITENTKYKDSLLKILNKNQTYNNPTGYAIIINNINNLNEKIN